MTRIEFARQLATRRGWVESGASDEEVIAALAENGITTQADNFRGDDTITRAEAATMFVRSSGGEADSLEAGLQSAFDSGIFTQVGDGDAEFQSAWFNGVFTQSQEDIDWSTVRTYEAWEQIVKERFPAWAWALDHPELAPILQDAAEGEFTADTFEANLRATEWFTSRSAAERAWDIQEADPANEAELQRQIAQRAGEIRDRSSTLGAQLSDEAIDALARDSLRRGLTEDEVTGQIVAGSPTITAGAVAAAEDQIAALASDQLVTIDDETRRSLALKIVNGEMNGDGLRSYVQNVARSQFPQFADMIDQGVSVREYTAPQRNVLASMLGRNPADIDFNGEFRDVLSIGDGGQTRAMSLSETERYGRTLDEYWQGQRGQEELSSMVGGLTRALGVRR